LKEATVDYNADLIKLDQIKDAIEDMGFDAAIKFGVVVDKAAVRPPQSTPNLIQLGDRNAKPLISVDELGLNRLTPTAAVAENRSTVRIGVDGMHCKSCVRKIEDNLRAAPGVVDVKVSLDDKKAVIVFDAAATDAEKLARAIADLDFVATLPNDEKFAPAPALPDSNKNAQSQLVKLPPPPLSSGNDATRQNSAVLSVESTSLSVNSRSPSRNGKLSNGSGNSRQTIDKRTRVIPERRKLMKEPDDKYDVIPMESDVERCFINVTGMTCASCVNNIERNVGMCLTNALLLEVSKPEACAKCV